MIFDHYQDFEGEPGITFGKADNTWSVTMWDGFFSDIISTAVVNNQGQWKTLAMYYHTGTGWNATSPFELVDTAEVGAELVELQFSDKEEDMLATYQDLLAVCRFALANNLFYLGR